MAEGLSPHDPRREHLDPLREAVERSARLIKDLPRATSPTPFAPVPLDLDGFLSGLRPLLEHLFGPTVRLEFDLGLEPAPLAVDHDALEQSVMNLALNARDAMEHGGRLRFATAEIRLDPTGASSIAGARPGRFARLTVEDDGCGMDEETRRRAFEPFFTTKASGRGSGLGLAAVRGFVERSGGFITLETAPGRGCRVDLHLPRDAG
jgi:signal transduction histidine kinase